MRPPLILSFFVLAAGQAVALPAPSGTLQIGAIPWGYVTVDGKQVATTPVNALTVSAGPHQVTVENPRLGTRSQTVLVPAGGTARWVVRFR